MKKKTTVFFILIFLAGIALLLYPTMSNAWNSLHATSAVTSYRETASGLTDAQYDEILSEAVEYNESLARGCQDYYLTENERHTYEALLNVDRNGMMGYIEIPTIDVVLPIYHGTDESVLQTSIGHLEWTSLPVGGESTHCVLSGHRGLPRARLFTDLDKLTPGDAFTVTVLGRTLTYEVDKIETVTPEQTEDLEIIEGEDLLTLVTCTPYGVNTHRLLVRGHRVENVEESAFITSEAVQIEPIVVMPFVAFPLLIIAFLLVRQADILKNRDEREYIDEKKIQ